MSAVEPVRSDKSFEMRLLKGVKTSGNIYKTDKFRPRVRFPVSILIKL